MSSDKSADRASKREQLQDARNAERGDIKKQLTEAAGSVAKGGLAQKTSGATDAVKKMSGQGESGDSSGAALKGDASKAGKPSPKKDAKGEGSSQSASEMPSAGKGKASAGAGGSSESGAPKESKGNAITDRSQSSHAVSDDDSVEEKTDASVSSAISKLDNKSKNKGEQLVDKAEDTAVAKAEQIGKKVGEEGVGGGAGKAVGAAAADATRLGVGAVKAGAKGATGNIAGAVKDAGVAIAKTKTFQKVMAVIVIPGCLGLAVIALVIVSSLGSTVVNMIVATSEEAQEQADIDVSDDPADDPDTDESPCRDDNPPDECEPASSGGDGGGGSDVDIDISEDGWTSPLPRGTITSRYFGCDHARGDTDSDRYSDCRNIDESGYDYHLALDLGTPADRGQPGGDVVAANEGVVEEADCCGSSEWMVSGEYVVINHGDDTYTVYDHLYMDSTEVSEGDEVEPGDVIGTEGGSGNTPSNSDFDTHLHFQIIVDGIHMDPERLYDEWGAELEAG